MNDEDREQLRELVARVHALSDAVSERDRFLTRLYDRGAEPSELAREAGIRSRSQLYGAFHRHGSRRVTERGPAHRAAALERWARQRGEGTS